MLINFYSTKQTSRLYETESQNSYFKSRPHGMVYMFSFNPTKIAKQSAANSLVDISYKIDFSWFFNE